MLLVHQTGSVRIGEVVRYTLTYTPSKDRMLPVPSQLHVKVRNTSAIPLRAAYLHGPYTLYAACYPATFDPNACSDRPFEDGSPEFEPNLKAGGSWMGKLTLPTRIRESAEKTNPQARPDQPGPSFTWIIEVASQVIFSVSASVNFELLVGRDAKSLELGFASLGSHAPATPGQLHDHQQSKRARESHENAAQHKGVFSHAIRLVVDDTVSLWNKPALPAWNDDGKNRGTKPQSSGLVNAKLSAGEVDLGTSEAKDAPIPKAKSRKRKRVHLVILTHGLHSNLGADMLYLKESIDAAAKKARSDARAQKAQARDHTKHEGADIASTKPGSATATAPLSGGQDELDSNIPDHSEDEDEEEVIVRGYNGNACRTERGIQYLGKRLAKWILSMTYPDQPFLPAKKSVAKKLSRVLTGQGNTDNKGVTHPHHNSSIYKGDTQTDNLAYQITSISFIAHSLGGLTQTYAIAYIQKHSPQFFDLIKPINFVAMAVPFLGLSNENPLYVKFALDFGLVGRTGQDLGLSWKSATALRGGWDAMIAGIGKNGERAQKQADPVSKPLLRILPTGHTHQVLKKFRNRTVYSNVVNDGIVPLRTSCLLFLDWSGLGRVEKARRENGIVAGLAGWGWAELTGTNASANRHLRTDNDSDAWSQSNVSGDEGSNRTPNRSRRPSMHSKIPQPGEDAVTDDNAGRPTSRSQPDESEQENASQEGCQECHKDSETSSQQPPHPFSGLLSLLRPTPTAQSHRHPHKHTKIYRRSQTVTSSPEVEGDPDHAAETRSQGVSPSNRRGPVRGDSYLGDAENVFAPPKTTIFESAGDLLNPPLPSREFLINPASRPRTIFHDRVYHPEDIPPPPTSKRSTKLIRSRSNDSVGTRSNSSNQNTDNHAEAVDVGNMKVEEKIARAYHHGLSWRKVLVRLEPDAHNNMVVRRMFANAYGWPVIKHLVDTHFAYTYEAKTEDQLEPSVERAKPVDQKVDQDGGEVKETPPPMVKRTDSEKHEVDDHVPEMKQASSGSGSAGGGPSRSTTGDTATWDEILSGGSDDDDDIDGPLDADHRHHLMDLPSELTAKKDSGSHESRKPESKSPPIIATQGFITSSSRVAESPKSTTSLGMGQTIEEQLQKAKQEQIHDDMIDAGDMATLSMENGH